MKLAPSNFSNFKILQKKKKKTLNLGSKIPYLGIFGLQFEKTNVIFEICSIKFF